MALLSWALLKKKTATAQETQLWNTVFTWYSENQSVKLQKTKKKKQKKKMETWTIGFVCQTFLCISAKKYSHKEFLNLFAENLIIATFFIQTFLYNYARHARWFYIQ